MEENNNLNEFLEQQVDQEVNETEEVNESFENAEQEHVISEENMRRSENMHISIQVFLKMAIPLMIVGWASVIFGVGLVIIQITGFLIGMQFIRRQEIKKGVLLIIFGVFTLGIWPFIEARKLAKNNEVKYIDYDSIEFKKSMYKGFNYGFFIAITGGMTLVLVIGFFIIPVACYFIAIQHFREDRIFYGVFMVMFGPMTLGIWPVFDSFMRRTRLKREIMSLS